MDVILSESLFFTLAAISQRAYSFLFRSVAAAAAASAVVAAGAALVACSAAAASAAASGAAAAKAHARAGVDYRQSPGDEQVSRVVRAAAVADYRDDTVA